VFRVWLALLAAMIKDLLKMRLRCNYVIKQERLLHFASELLFRNRQIELSLGSHYCRKVVGCKKKSGG
jgi:hypothetical protein